MQSRTPAFKWSNYSSALKTRFMILLMGLVSPLLIAALAIILVVYVKLAALKKPSIAFLIGRSLLYAVIGVIASLVLVIIWMIWYESSTGYGAGNAPLAWIFFYGPVSAALGQLAALTQWWFRRSAALP